MLDGFRIFSPTVVKEPKFFDSIPIIRTQCGSLFVGSLRLRNSTRRFMAMGHALQSIGAAWIQSEGMLKLLHRKIMIAGKLMDTPQRYIGDGKMIVQFRRFLAIGLRFVKPLWIYVELVFQAKSLTELGITEGESRVRLDGRIECGDGVIKVTGLVVALDQAQGHEIGLVSSGGDAAAGGAQHLGGGLDVHESGEA